MMRNAKRRMVVLGVLSSASLVGLLVLAVRAVHLSPAWMRASAASPLGVRCLVIIGVGMLALGAAAMVLVRVRGVARARAGNVTARKAGGSNGGWAVGRKGIATDQGGTAA
ncbi:MAG: hypothetical protein NTX40_09810, partial [Planctomycetota bacterium]|nr:hypothetical protein [Planctomycetota bacterium]